MKNLEEDIFYSFEVSAVSLTDDVLTSKRFRMEIPAYHKSSRNRAISMGIVAGLGFLAAALAAVWWAKKRFCHPQNGEK